MRLIGNVVNKATVTPLVTLDQVTEPTPEDLEHLARSVAMSGVLGGRDRLDVVVALRRLAETEQGGEVAALRQEAVKVSLNVMTRPSFERYVHRPAGTTTDESSWVPRQAHRWVQRNT